MPYHPILKWRSRELSALRHLAREDRESITPIFEVPPEPWNFDTGRPLRSGPALFQEFGQRLAHAWGALKCAIDAPHESREDATLQSMIIDSVFHQARMSGCWALPVVGLERSEMYVNAVRRILAKDGHGLYFRIRQSDLCDQLDIRIASLLELIGIEPSRCDLLLDFEGYATSSAGTYADAVAAAVDQLPFVRSWRSIVLSSTAMPAALPFDLYWPHGIVPRTDWTGFRSASALLHRRGLAISFSDYGVYHPNTEMVDPRLIGRDAALVYCNEENWVVFASAGTQTGGIRAVAERWKAHTFPYGSTHDSETRCWADAQIDRICEGEISADELELWPQLATNRHLWLACRQARNFPSQAGTHSPVTYGEKAHEQPIWRR